MTINPDSDATSDTVAKEKAGEKKDQKDGHILLDTPKGATWGIPVTSGIFSFVVSLGASLSLTDMLDK